MKNNTSLLVAVSVAMGLVGCSSKTTAPSTASTTNTTTNTPVLTSADSDYQNRLAELERREQELRSRASSNVSASSDSSLLPPNPKVGECYARVLIPAIYKTESQKVLIAEASEKISVIPAQYKVVQKRIEVSPAKKKIVQVPATYKWETVKVLHKPAYTTWKRGSGVTASGALKTKTTDTGELMCLVEIPAEYKTIKKKVVNKAAYTKTVEVPAVYKTVKVTETVKEATENRQVIPAKYDTVTNRAKVKDEYLEWRRVWCKTNMTRDNVYKLQKALKTRGFYRGPIDGYIGKGTLSAANRYASSKNLAHGSNYVTYDILNSCLLYTSPSPRDRTRSRMPSSA